MNHEGRQAHNVKGLFALLTSFVSVVSFVVLVSGSTEAQPASDPAVFDRIKREALERSRVEEIFNELTVTIGPRLTASPAHKRAAQFVRERLTAYGLTNARLEPWKFG